MNDARERFAVFGSSFGGAQAHARIRDELAKIDLAGMGRKMDDAADALAFAWHALSKSSEKWVALSGRAGDWKLDP